MSLTIEFFEISNNSFSFKLLISGLNIFKKYSPSLNPGDCIIHNSYVVHGSDKNISNSPRVGWTLRFKAKDNKIDPMRKKQYEKELVFQIKMRKKSARI